MRWERGGRSENLEDRRGASPGGPGLGRLGLGTVVLVVIVALVTKQNPVALLGMLEGGRGAIESALPPGADSASEEQVQFVSWILDDAQGMWPAMVREAGSGWRDAKLVLFRDRVQSACGFAQAASGPFYCPGDEKVYIDLGFYTELAQRFGAPGDFAQAYVLAHELGHHVQKLLGTEAAVRERQTRQPMYANQFSVLLELQADCYAGIWARHAAKAGRLDAGDLDEGLRAAASVGDDRLQRMAEGAVHPESWTHGSSAQRASWFRRGFDDGSIASCDTFAEKSVVAAPAS